MKSNSPDVQLTMAVLYSFSPEM